MALVRVRRLRRRGAARAAASPTSISRSRRRRCRFSPSICRPRRCSWAMCGAVPLGFLAAVFGLAGIRCRDVARVVPGARLPAVHRGRDGDARPARRGAANAFSKRTRRITISGCIRLGAGHRGHTARLRRADRRHLRISALCLAIAPAAGWRVLVAWTVAIGVCLAALTIIGADGSPSAMKTRTTGAPRSRSSTTSCAAALAWVAMYLAALQPRLPGAVRRRHGRDARWILPLQATIFLALGLYRGLWRFASLARPAADRARRGPRRDADPARARDAAAADGRAAQRADVLSDRAHLPDGRRPLRVPHLEGASPLQPARGARRAGAGRRRRRGGRATHARKWRAAGSGASWGCSTTIRRSRAGCCATSACWGRSRACRRGRDATACAR